MTSLADFSPVELAGAITLGWLAIALLATLANSIFKCVKAAQYDRQLEAQAHRLNMAVILRREGRFSEWCENPEQELRTKFSP